MGKRGKHNSKKAKYKPPEHCDFCDSLSQHIGIIKNVDREQKVLDLIKDATDKKQLVFEGKDHYGYIF